MPKQRLGGCRRSPAAGNWKVSSDDLACRGCEQRRRYSSGGTLPTLPGDCRKRLPEQRGLDSESLTSLGPHNDNVSAAAVMFSDCGPPPGAASSRTAGRASSGTASAAGRTFLGEMSSDIVGKWEEMPVAAPPVGRGLEETEPMMVGSLDTKPRRHAHWRKPRPRSRALPDTTALATPTSRVFTDPAEAPRVALGRSGYPMTSGFLSFT